MLSGKGLPNLPSNINDPALRQFLGGLKQAIEGLKGHRGEDGDRAVLLRELTGAGIIATSGSGAIVPGPGGGGGTGGGGTGGGGTGGGGTGGGTPFDNPSVPPTPTGVFLTATTTNVYIIWDRPEPAWVAYAEIWKAGPFDTEQTGPNAPQIEDAWLAGTPAAFSTIYLDVVEPLTWNYYWVRFVSYKGTIGPWHSLTPVGIQTPNSAANYLRLLEDSLNETHLAQYLRDRIDLIDSPLTGLVDRLAQEIQDRAAAVSGEAQARANAITQESIARALALSEETNARILALNQETDARILGLANEADARASALAAETEARNNAITAETNARINAIAAEILARQNADIALDGRVDVLEVEVSGGGGTVSAILTRINQVGGSADTLEAFYTDYLALNAAVSDGVTGLNATRVLAQNLEQRINSVDGGTLSLEQFFEDYDVVQLFVNNPTTGLAATRTLSTTVSNRIDSVNGAGQTVEQFWTSADAVRLAVDHGTTGLAATRTLATTLQNRINSVDGNGQTVEQFWTTIDGVRLAVENPATGLVATRNLASSLSNRIDSVNGAGQTVEQFWTSADAVRLAVDHGTTGLAATRTLATTLQNRLNSVDGGSTTLEQMWEDVDTVSLSVNHPTTGLSAVRTATETLGTRLDTAAGGSYEAFYSSFDGVRLSVNDPSTGLAATRTSVTNETNARVVGDQALADQIALLSAGSGDQFDQKVIWHFDSSAESWTSSVATGAVTLSTVDGWLQLPATSGTATNPAFISPTALAIVGVEYPQIRARIKKVGTPTWDGKAYFMRNADSEFSDTYSVTIDEPTFDANGVAFVTWNMPASWSATTIKQIRVDLATEVTTANYYRIDWLAIGRPSPGASNAALLLEASVRAQADSAETTARNTLSTSVIGTTNPAGVTLATLSSGLLYDERQARSSADSSQVTARESLATLLTGVANPSSGLTLGALTSGLVYSEREARSSAIGSEASSRQTLSTALIGATTPGGVTLTNMTSGLLYDERQARSAADSSEVSARQTLATTVIGTTNPTGLTLTSLSSGLLYDERQARSSADSSQVTARESLATLLTGVANPSSGLTLGALTSGLVYSEREARSSAVSSEASSRQLLSTALIGTPSATGVTLANMTAGLLFEERQARSSADSSQVSQINTLQARAENPFDTFQAWYFNTTAESWTAASDSGTSSFSVTSLGRLSLAASSGTVVNPRFVSPVLSIVGSTYSQVRVLIHRVGTPTWEGRVYFQRSGDAGFNITYSEVVAEPTWVAPGYAVMVVNMPATWRAATIIGLRLDLATQVTTTNYYEVDWVAVGREAPGAGSATHTRVVQAETRLNTAFGGNTYESFVTEFNSLKATTENPTTGLAALYNLATREIESYWQTTAPVGTAYAIGDLWFDTDASNLAYKWSGSAWVLAPNDALANGLRATVTAQATADGKVKTFVQGTQPVATGVGDLWFDTANQNRAYRWNGVTWASIRDTHIQEALTNAGTALTLAGSKVTTYWASTAPTTISHPNLTIGDLWFDTDSDNQMYRWANVPPLQWVLARDAGIADALGRAISAQDTADGKAQIFFQTTGPLSSVGLEIGDLWFDTDDGHRAYRWTGTAWTAIPLATTAQVTAAITDNNFASIGFCEIGGTPNGTYTTPTACSAAGGIWKPAQPLAQAVKQVSITTGSGTAALEQLFQAHEDDLGDLTLQYSVKFDQNGRVTGFGLYSTGPQGATTTDAIFRVDRFAIAAPGVDGDTAYPFIVDAQSGNVVMDGAYIKDASIDFATINFSLTAPSVIAGFGGFLEANITNGMITNAKIGNIIESDGFVSGSHGWRIDKGGHAEFNDITVYDPDGRVAFQTGQNYLVSVDDVPEPVNITSNPDFSEQYLSGTIMRPTGVQITHANDGILSQTYNDTLSPKGMYFIYNLGAGAQVAIVRKWTQVKFGHHYRIRARVRVASFLVSGATLTLRVNQKNSLPAAGVEYILDTHTSANSIARDSSTVMGSTPYASEWYDFNIVYTPPAGVVAFSPVLSFQCRYTVGSTSHYTRVECELLTVASMRAVVGTTYIRDAAITSAKIQDAAIQTLKIADNAVTVMQYASFGDGSAQTYNAWQERGQFVINHGHSSAVNVLIDVSVQVDGYNEGYMQLRFQINGASYNSPVLDIIRVRTGDYSYETTDGFLRARALVSVPAGNNTVSVQLITSGARQGYYDLSATAVAGKR